MKLLIALLLSPLFLFAQQKQPVTSVQPDCMVFFNLTVASSGAQAAVNSAGTSIVIDNHQAGCYGWTVDYANHGFSALSLSFQSAPDNTAGTAPGTWASFAGTLVTCDPLIAAGVNPNTATTQATTCAIGYFPWVRMNLLSKTGTGGAVGVLYGFKRSLASKGGGSGGGLCPGAGAAGDVQYTDGTNCVSAADFKYILANLQVQSPVGTDALPGMAFNGHPSVGFYYDTTTGSPATEGFGFAVTATTSGINTYTFTDNDSWRCRESDQAFQRGSCEVFSTRIANNARFFDLTDTFLNWGDPAGGGAGNRVGVGRFSSEGATAAAVHVALSDGGTHVPIEPLSAIFTGCTFATLGTTCANNNGTVTSCADCQVTSSIDDTCATGGTGAVASRINGAWKCMQ